MLAAARKNQQRDASKLLSYNYDEILRLLHWRLPRHAPFNWHYRQWRSPICVPAVAVAIGVGVRDCDCDCRSVSYDKVARLKMSSDTQMRQSPSSKKEQQQQQILQINAKN